MVDNISGYIHIHINPCVYAIYTVYYTLYISDPMADNISGYAVYYTLYISDPMVDNISGYMRYTQLANFSARLHWGVALSVTCTNGSLLTDQGKGLQYRCPVVSSQLGQGQLGLPNN